VGPAPARRGGEGLNSDPDYALSRRALASLRQAALQPFLEEALLLIEGDRLARSVTDWALALSNRCLGVAGAGGMIVLGPATTSEAPAIARPRPSIRAG